MRYIKSIFCNVICITDSVNTRQNRVLDKELHLIARQDDQEVKHKSLIEYMEFEGIQE
jgi:hypothetical protein